MKAVAAHGMPSNRAQQCPAGWRGIVAVLGGITALIEQACLCHAASDIGWASCSRQYITISSFLKAQGLVEDQSVCNTCMGSDMAKKNVFLLNRPHCIRDSLRRLRRLSFVFLFHGIHERYFVVQLDHLRIGIRRNFPDSESSSKFIFT
jgi:hypothetical protein